MKKTFILLPLAGLLFYVALSGSSLGPGLAGDGDRTGASGPAGCSTGIGCHASSATPSTTVGIQLYDVTKTTVITNYVGGTSYIIRITGTNTGATSLPKFGFQVSVVKSGGTSNEGTLSAITGTHLGTYGGIKIVEHSMALSPTTLTGGTGTTYVVDIPWTAPVAGTGTVKVFTALNAVNGDASADPQDLWNTASLPIPEATSTVAAITGTMSVCVGATTALTDATAGGTWSSSSTGIATIGATGIVTGVAAGTATITYNAGTSGNATTVVTVISGTPAAIVGANLLCIGTHIILSDAIGGGTWTSTTTTIATAGGINGVVSGVALGIDTIKYTITNSCGTGTVTHTVTVKALGGTCVSSVNAMGNPLQTELKVYPNPNWGAFSMNLLSENNDQAYVVITNLLGDKVKEFTTIANRDVDVQLSGISGIYFISATTLHGRYVAKVIVQ